MRLLPGAALCALCLLMLTGCGGETVTPSADAPPATDGNAAADGEATPAANAAPDATTDVSKHPELAYITDDMAVAVRLQGLQVQKHPIAQLLLKQLPEDSDEMTQLIRGSDTTLMMLSKTPSQSAGPADGPPMNGALVNHVVDQKAYDSFVMNVQGDPSLPLMPEGKTQKDIYDEYDAAWNEWQDKGGDPATEPEMKRYRPRPVEYNGKTLYLNNGLAAMFPGDNWMVFANEDVMKKIIDTKIPNQDLISKLTALGLDNEVVAVGDMAAMRKAIEPLRPMLEEQAGPGKDVANTALDKIDTFQLKIDLDGDKLVHIETTSADDAGAKEISEMAENYKQQALPAASIILPFFDGENEDKPVTKMATGLIDSIEIKSNGKGGTFAVNKPADFDQWPQKMQPVIDAMQSAKRKADRTNNMKQILLAFLNYHDTFRRFPANATYSKDGKALSSWRVALLPFLEQANIYDIFDFSQPWNKGSNAKLAGLTITVYADGPDSGKFALGNFEEQERFDGSGPEKPVPAVAVPPVDGKVPDDVSKTRYQVFVGPGSVFDTSQGNRIAAVADGTSNTIMMIETGPGKAVPWSQPADIPFEKDTDLMKAIGEPTDGVYIVGYVDGSVYQLTPEQLKKQFRAMVTRNGRELIERP